MTLALTPATWPTATLLAEVRFLRTASTQRPAAAATTETDRFGQWMVDAGRGDQEAFGRLYDELGGFVLGIVVRVMRDRARSEEVTQEVFVELWRLAARFDPAKGSVKAWIATVAHRRAVDRVRSVESARERDQRAVDEHRVAPAGPEELTEDDFERRRVRRALDSLTELQREAVELAYYGGHTYREVAALLGVAEGTVKTRIRDGLIRLRGELGDLS